MTQTSPASIDPVALSARLDAVVERALRERRVVGAVGIVAQHGKLLYRRAHGLADREAHRPMREDTLFRLASVTKPIVALAALRLVASKALALDAPVTRWLPGFRPKLENGEAPEMTIHHLLTHTAGLGYWLLDGPGSLYDRLGISDGLDLCDFGLDENLRRLAEAPLAFAPGTGWQYSLALDVLGAVIERATGTTLAQAVATLVGEPLGLRDSGFVSNQPERFATPYYGGSPEPVRMADGVDVPMPEGQGAAVRFAPSRVFEPGAYPSGGAGMYGCADDVLRVLEAIRDGGRFLPDALAEAARRDQVGAAAETRGPGWGFGYLGAVLSDPALAQTRMAAGTLAWGGVYGHSWFVDPAWGLSVLLLTNTAYEGMSGALKIEFGEAVYAG
ncbi:serine hydrolase domain-containing protein [Burkholderia glumae]|uniref:Beta-lactamase family protein n=1 Tax=Burkholderia glumae TaxID=337 RepID=A0AAQ0BQC4_BURGL|nr:serine hydrolase domain-containing protein [Burkholderia glumae]ACR31597.1 beta-lactamase [Burkholderia glumae BGR1]AJY64225.1 esterase estB [Burkholderia glumae LMG 2196 = ATCC 33617]KHJ61101.1 beta-lactamase [Burkholderia glumae]MCM2485239.1 beta-lactamase family protein [Burkholderia glumae]MCM2510934.1 beta-lactamase family protein [Burkholderia glumae]